MSMLLWNLCKASLSTGSHGVASLGVQHIAGSSLLHATLVGVGTGWGETGVWPYEAVTRYVSWCGNPYTMIFRLFQCRGPKHFPEEAEICVRWSFFFFFLSYLSWIPYRLLPSGAHKPWAENHCCKHTHKSSNGTNVVCRLSFTSHLFCLSRLQAFQGRNCHFLCIMLNTARTWFQVTILEPQQWIAIMNEHSDCHLVSGRIPPQKPSKSETWLQWSREGGERSFPSQYWLSHLLILATILLVQYNKDVGCNVHFFL